MSTKFKGQRQWIREVLGKFGELQKFQPEPFKRDLKWPEWVANLLLILLRMSHPGVKVKNTKKWKAKHLGRLLGRHYAVEHLGSGEVPLSLQVIQEGERALPWMEKEVRSRWPSFDFKKFQQEHEQQTKVWRPKLREFMQQTLSSACERPYVEAAAFFEAFGKAIVMKPDELLTERKMSVSDKICMLMFVRWQEIERLHSVAELQRVLVKAFKPHGIVIRYKRVEKLCQRIKLKFRGPGRPPGSKIQTNPESV